MSTTSVRRGADIGGQCARRRPGTQADQVARRWYGSIVLTVREIWRYPVKSIGGERLDVGKVGEHGIAGDRQWGVRDVMTGMVLTGRREPRLLMANARVEHGEPVIELGDGSQLHSSGELSAWLDRPVELVAASDTLPTFEGVDDPETERQWSTWQGQSGTFHDGRSTVTMASDTTLAGYDPRRFRLNLILEHSGSDTEDALVDADLTIGTTGLYVRKPIDRCVMVTRAQLGLDRDLGVLQRVVRERNNRLGVGCVVHREGLIATGDVVMPFPR